jgi:hypothetical protein
VGARKTRGTLRNIVIPLNIFCCDSASLIDLRDAGLLREMRGLVQNNRVRIPEGVYKELQQKTDKLANTIEQWRKKYSIVIDLDPKALELLPDLERNYGP